MTKRTCAAALLLAGGWAMNALSADAVSGRGPLLGYWGGDRLQLVADAQGARVELECASGTLAGPLTPGADGRFQVGGTYQAHGGGSGPQRADEPAAKAPAARYSGQLQDGVLRLSILPDGATAPQVYVLREGARVKMVRCL